MGSLFGVALHTAFLWVTLSLTILLRTSASFSKQWFLNPGYIWIIRKSFYNIGRIFFRRFWFSRSQVRPELCIFSSVFWSFVKPTNQIWEPHLQRIQVMASWTTSYLCLTLSGSCWSVCSHSDHYCSWDCSDSQVFTDLLVSPDPLIPVILLIPCSSSLRQGINFVSVICSVTRCNDYLSNIYALWMVLSPPLLTMLLALAERLRAVETHIIWGLRRLRTGVALHPSSPL